MEGQEEVKAAKIESELSHVGVLWMRRDDDLSFRRIVLHSKEQMVR